MKAKATKKQPVPTFADALTRGMSDVGYTDETLSEVVHYAPDTIYRFRTGKMVPPMRTRNVFLQAITARREA